MELEKRVFGVNEVGVEAGRKTVNWNEMNGFYKIHSSFLHTLSSHA